MQTEKERVLESPGFDTSLRIERKMSWQKKGQNSFFSFGGEGQVKRILELDQTHEWPSDADLTGCYVVKNLLDAVDLLSNGYDGH